MEGEALKAEAKERQRAGGKTAGRGRPKKGSAGSGGTYPKAEARDVAAKLAA
jgi:hypothetical protein